MSSKATSEFSKYWMKKEAVPIYGIIGISALMVGYHITHKLTGNDIVYNHKKNPRPFLESPADYNPAYIKIKEKEVFDFSK
ncbi:hypothetical protein AYI69_g3919 [Smittium culicis]|uniref:Uncharacterized protein n=1 Tax=Smittium culicis TaxID=133412 RepID=A0A1R1YIG0_9FUNG|nr:hypothetical protein AYI69_g9942 [Smittium culicis]OMJ26673.1 hypothetical protein AYI69_g3919 [Smittium culicis]